MKIIEKMMEITGLSREAFLDECPINYKEMKGKFKIMCLNGESKCQTCLEQEVILSEDEQRCRICGCTWFNACEGGCYWVKEDLCNRCLGK